MAQTPVKKAPIVTLEQSLATLCGDAKVQSGQHIKRVHAFCSNRLVLEGGFPPEWVSPHPPIASIPRPHNEWSLTLNPKVESMSEQSILGGMRYKNLDVAILPPGIGPALGISVKSTGNAFRNLANRMDEAPGDCVNIHMMYPGFVFGFIHLIKHSRLGEVISPNDASFDSHGRPLESIIRYHNALCALTGRGTIADPPMRYESISLLVYRCLEDRVEIWPEYPASNSPLHYSGFFQRLYDTYLRYAYPDARGLNHRKNWLTNTNDYPDEFDNATGYPWQVRRVQTEEQSNQ